jgi:hypothetical protein
MKTIRTKKRIMKSKKKHFTKKTKNNKHLKTLKKSKKNIPASSSSLSLLNEHKKYTLDFNYKTSVYKNFSDIIFHATIINYMKQFNNNEIYFPKKIVDFYNTIKDNLFYEYRIFQLPVPFPILTMTNLMSELYEKNNIDICVISNSWSPIIPFFTFNWNPGLFNKIKKIKIMLFKNPSLVGNQIQYSKMLEILENIKSQKIIEIEGGLDYDINNYLNNYIQNKTSYTKKYKTALIIFSYHLNKIHLYNHVLTALFNLSVNGTLILYTPLLHHIQNTNTLFTLLMTLFKDYTIIRQKNSDYIYQYTYLYKFYNFKEIKENVLQEIAKLLINSNNNDTDFDISNIIHVKHKNIMRGRFLEYNIISEANKYCNIMENKIKYLKNDPINFFNFIGKITMNRIFLINNDINKLKITYDLKSIKNIINDYNNNICCFKDYYRNIEQKINRHVVLDLESNLQIISKKYLIDSISKFIFNIDIAKQITNNCSNKKLSPYQIDLINYNTNKKLLIDIIINNISKNEDNDNSQYILDSLLFVEQIEILNNYIPSLQKLSDNQFNYLYFGKKIPQFLYSFDYFIKKKRYQTSNINIYTDLKNDNFKNKTNNITVNLLDSNKINDVPIHFISCDDVLDIEIDGYDIKTIDRYDEDTFTSSFYIMDDKEREDMDNKIMEFEYSEFYKICMTFSSLSVGGDCCIKHVALPLNSYLFYKGYENISGFFVNYIYLYSHLFGNVKLYKPSVTSNQSLEFYVIGTNFLGIENKLKDKLLKILDNFELHQTFFKKEEINELFIKEVETFLGLMSNRYVDYEDIVTLLKEDLLNNNSNNIGTKKNEIISIFMNKSLLYKELNTVVYDIWKNNNRLGSISNMTKLYYFTKFDIPDLNKITFDFTVFEKILDKNNFIKMNSKYDAKDAPNAVWFIHTYLSRKNFSIPKNTTLINMLNDYSLAYKDKLYQICNDYNKTLTSKYFMETYLLNKKDDIEKYEYLFKNNNPWYIKIVNEFAGKGNFIISSFNEFKELINKLKNKKATLKKGTKISENADNLIINRYIESPLLFDKKKFHIRMLYIVYVNSKKTIKSYLSKYGFIWTAKDDYNDSPEYYYDTKIHDSHSSSTKTDYLFPTDFEKVFGKNKTNLVMDKILNIFRFIANVQINNISNFPNAKNGYNILGADLIIDSDFNVKILELNNKTGLYTKKRDTNVFITNYLYGNIYNEIITDVFNIEKIKVSETFVTILPST